MTPTEGDIEFSHVLIVEDDLAMRERIISLVRPLLNIDASVVTAISLAEARLKVEAQPPQLALVDIGLPDGSGIDLIQWLQQTYPHTASVVISAWGHEETVLAALRAGSVGYLLKEREDQELSLALQTIRRGGAPIDPFIARRILLLMATPQAPQAGEAASARANDAHLSEREVEILQLVSRGYSNREIAQITTLSRFTIEGYTKSIYRKLAVSSRTAAVYEAKALGLLR